MDRTCVDELTAEGLSLAARAKQARAEHDKFKESYSKRAS